MRLSCYLFCALLLFACGQNETPPPTEQGKTRVRLALNWFPEAEHGGFYAAHIHGYYAKRNLEVEILGGGPDAPVIQRVSTGAIEFGVTNADDVLYARAQQAPVVALMAPYQINPRCIMVHESSGIERIDQISNITLAMSQRPAFSHYLRWKYPLEGVNIVPYPGNVSQFLANPNFAQQGYVFSEPFVARQQGGDPRALLVSDIGFNPYASVIIATEETIAQRANIVRALVEASIEGWEHYLRDGQETNQYINSLNPEMGLDILAYGVEKSAALVLDPVASEKGLGHMSSARWNELHKQMVEAGLIKAEGGVEGAFDTQFLR